MSLYEKLLKAQKSILSDPILKESVNPYFGSNYADIAALLLQAVPKFNDAGLSVFQPTVYENGGLFVKTIIIDHESKESIEGVISVTPAKINDPQSVGSAITYARRYGLQSLLALPAIDDDGNSASKPAPSNTPKRVPNAQQSMDGVQGNKFVMPFGSDKGKSFKDIDHDKLLSAKAWCIEKGKFDNLVEEIDEFLGMNKF